MCDKIMVALTPKQLQVALAGLMDGTMCRANLAKMWDDLAKNETDPTDRVIAEEYARQQKETADALDDLVDLFSRAYYAN